MGAHRELPALRAHAAALLTGRAGHSASAGRPRGGRSRPYWLLVAIAMVGVGAIAVWARARPAGVTSVVGAKGVTSMTAWSEPASLGGCAGAESPWVVFPSDSPRHSTGAGAIVWSTGAQCAGEEGVLVATIGSHDVPLTPAPARVAGGGEIALRDPLEAAGAPHGDIVIAGSAPPGAPPGGLFTEGHATGPFSRPLATAGPASPVALDTAYLDDIAIASPVPGSGVALRVQRHMASAFAGPVAASPTGPGPVESLRVALDYRSDALVVWRAAGAIYARYLPASGRAHPIERLGGAGPEPEIAALASDDGRGIVAWADRATSDTSIYLDISAVGARFGRPRLLERFADPDGLASPNGSPSLVRLSSETVMIAWAGSAQGRWVVRTAPVYTNGLQSVNTISATGADALLAALVPGPRDDAFVLWTEPQRTAQGLASTSRQAIFAARGTDERGGVSVFGAPEQLAPAGPNGDPAVAVDPDSDRAVAAWKRADGRIAYSIRAASMP